MFEIDSLEDFELCTDISKLRERWYMNSKRKVWVNGNLIPESEAKVLFMIQL